MQIKSSDPAAAPASNTTTSKPTADYVWNAMRFSSLMNMARPENASIDETVRSPHMSLAKYSFTKFSDSPVSIQEGSRLTDMDFSSDGMARALVRELGDGQGITRDAALKALAAGRVNSEKTIAAYFERLDRDKSGALSVSELKELFDYKAKHDDDTPGVSPRLPDSWA